MVISLTLFFILPILTFQHSGNGSGYIRSSRLADRSSFHFKWQNYFSRRLPKHRIILNYIILHYIINYDKSYYIILYTMIYHIILYTMIYYIIYYDKLYCIKLSCKNARHVNTPRKNKKKYRIEMESIVTF